MKLYKVKFTSCNYKWYYVIANNVTEIEEKAKKHSGFGTIASIELISEDLL